MPRQARNVSHPTCPTCGRRIRKLAVNVWDAMAQCGRHGPYRNLARPCGRCNAKAWDFCETSTGSILPLSKVHASRLAPPQTRLAA